jgi:hypothetical protein
MKRAIREQIQTLINQATNNKSVLLTHPLVVQFFDGDHNAAFLLNQIAYWSERTTDRDGWFYKRHTDWQHELALSDYQVRRVIYGDPRVINRKRNLSDIGLETKRRRAPDGNVAVYYRLDLSQFFSMFTDWLGETFGQVVQTLTPTAPTAPVAPAIPTTPVATTPSTPPQKPLSPQLNLPWRDDLTIADVWRVARELLKNQYDDANFSIFIRDLQLVDYDPTRHAFTLQAPNNATVQRMHPRLRLHIQQIIQDVYGQGATVKIIPPQRE